MSLRALTPATARQLDPRAGAGGIRAPALLAILLLPASLAARDLARELRVAAQNGDDERVVKLLGEVGPKPSSRLLTLVLKLGVTSRSKPVYRATRAALAALRNEKALALLERSLSRSRDRRLRTLALYALEDIELPETVRPLASGLKHRDPNTRVLAARALGRKPWASSVEALVGAIEEADAIGGELAVTVRRSLWRLTRKSFATGADWKKWWKFEKASWTPPAGDGGGRTRLGGFRPPGDFPSFFGVEITSLRVVFVIDTSGSMTEPARGLGMTRLELVKDELVRSIEELDPRTRFTVMSFNSEIATFSEKLVGANAAAKRKAVAFVKALRPASTTWTQEALEAAFAIEEANTIVLLSDGSPCKGGPILPTEPILESVERLNRFRKVTIHTVGFREAYIPFLRALATQNEGAYRSAVPRRLARPEARLQG